VAFFTVRFVSCWICLRLSSCLCACFSKLRPKWLSSSRLCVTCLSEMLAVRPNIFQSCVPWVVEIKPTVALVFPVVCDVVGRRFSQLCVAQSRHHNKGSKKKNTSQPETTVVHKKSRFACVALRCAHVAALLISSGIRPSVRTRNHRWRSALRPPCLDHHACIILSAKSCHNASRCSPALPEARLLHGTRLVGFFHTAAHGYEQ